MYEFFLASLIPSENSIKEVYYARNVSSEDVSSTQECTTYLKQDGMFFSGLLSGWRGSTTGLVDFPQGVPAEQFGHFARQSKDIRGQPDTCSPKALRTWPPQPTCPHTETDAGERNGKNM